MSVPRLSSVIKAPFALALLAVLLAAGLAAAQDIDNSRGVDARVDYKGLTAFGPWDDRNYQLTLEDLELLAPNEAELKIRIPAFFRVEWRRANPDMRREGPAQYPRSAPEEFRQRYGGLMIDGVVERPEHAPEDVPVNGEVVIDAGAESAIAVNPVNPNQVIAGFNTDFPRQRMVYSTDGGSTWNFAADLPSSCCDPTVGWSSDGAIAYTAALRNCFFGCEVAAYRSTDGGQTWTNQVLITTGGSDKEYLHVDAHPSSPYLDNVYVTWHDGNDMKFSRSTDMGVSYSSPYTFPTSSEYSGIGSDIATDTAGRIFYVWPAFNSQKIWVSVSTDGGVSFGTPIEISTTFASFDFPIPVMDSRYAWIYAAADADTSGGANNDSVYVAWTDTTAPESGVAANNHTVIKFAYSRDNGATWTVLIPHATDDNEEVDRFNHWMEVDLQGVIHLVYYTTEYVYPSRTSVDLAYIYSQDGGVTWSDPTRITQESSPKIDDGFEWGDYNGLDVNALKVHPIWTDNRTEVVDVDSIDVYTADVTNVTGSPDFFLTADNLQQTVCRPDDIDPVTIEVGNFQGFVNPVTLVYGGLPAGFSGTIIGSPVIPPGNATATMSIGGAAMPGDHDIDILGTATGSDGHDLTMTITVQTDTSAPPMLVSPPDGEPNAGFLAVALDWADVFGATGYRVQVDTDPAFSAPVVDDVVDDSGHLVGGLTEGEVYYWRVATLNGCGEGPFSAPWSFTASAELVYFVVDDSDSSIADYFTDTFDALGVAYRQHPVGTTPTSGEMLSHPVVVWTCGNLGSVEGSEVTELENYLAGGGRLFLSAQDYLWPYRPNVPPFGQNVLGIATVDNDGGDYTSVSGVAGSPFDGLGPYTVEHVFSDWADEVTAGGPGTLALIGNNGNGAAITTDTTVFFAFSFEAIANNSSEATSADAQELMQAIIDHLTFVAEPPLFADGFEDGTVGAWTRAVP
jgi:hypothetical protein